MEASTFCSEAPDARRSVERPQAGRQAEREARDGSDVTTLRRRGRLSDDIDDPLRHDDDLARRLAFERLLHGIERQHGRLDRQP